MPPWRAAPAVLITQLLLCALVAARAVTAQEVLPGVPEGQLFVADIELQTSDQFIALLERSEQLLLDGVPLPQDSAPVTFVLHGPVLETLLRGNYLENKRLVDLAAALSALDVIEVKACKAWMENAGLKPAQLQPFVEAVPYGAGLVERLVGEENYRYF